MKAQAFLEQHADFSPTVPGPSTAVALFTKTHDHPNHAGVRAWPVGKVNIRKVDLQLQSKLAARLSTLQKACVAAVFEANPAGCPEASDIGQAIVHTPILNNPLSGPAYLVSHGNEAFPDVVFVLQGEGITIVLEGGARSRTGLPTPDSKLFPMPRSRAK